MRLPSCELGPQRRGVLCRSEGACAGQGRWARARHRSSAGAGMLVLPFVDSKNTAASGGKLSVAVCWGGCTHTAAVPALWKEIPSG